jgi:cytochrome c oxidase cbb3-type subunit I/II
MYFFQNICKESPEIKEHILYQKKNNTKNYIPLDKREIIALIAYLQRVGRDISIPND